MLDNRHGDAGDVSFLEGVCADRGTRHLAGDRDDRDRVHVGIGDGGDEVRGAGAGGGHAHADLAGGLCVALSGVARALFVADQDVAHLLGVHQRVVGGQDRTTGDAEYGLDPGMLQRLDQTCCAGQVLGHGLPSCNEKPPGPEWVTEGSAPVPGGLRRARLRESGAAHAHNIPRARACQLGGGLAVDDGKQIAPQAPCLPPTQFAHAGSRPPHPTHRQIAPQAPSLPPTQFAHAGGGPPHPTHAADCATGTFLAAHAICPPHGRAGPPPPHPTHGQIAPQAPSLPLTQSAHAERRSICPQISTLAVGEP